VVPKSKAKFNGITQETMLLKSGTMLNGLYSGNEGIQTEITLKKTLEVIVLIAKLLNKVATIGVMAQVWTRLNRARLAIEVEKHSQATE
jgi:hypothetical protein